MKNLNQLLIAVILLFAMLGCNKDGGGNIDANSAAVSTGTGGSTARFTIVGNYLYTVDKEKLKVFSLVNPGDPVLKNTQNIGFEIETIFPFGDKLFIGSTSVIHIFSITNPESPQKLSTAISPTVMRRCDPVVAKDTVAYATLRTNGPCGGISSQLVAFDIHDIINPLQRASISVTEPYGLGYSDTVLYVCDRTGLNLYNISKAYQPQYIRTFSGNWYLDVIPYGNTLICWVNDGLILFDISNRVSPQFIAKII